MTMLQQHLGDAFALATAFSWALGVVWFRKSQAYFSAPALNFFKNIVGIICLTLTLVLSGRWDALELESEAIALMVVSGALGIGVADTMFLSAFRDWARRRLQLSSASIAQWSSYSRAFSSMRY